MARQVGRWTEELPVLCYDPTRVAVHTASLYGYIRYGNDFVRRVMVSKNGRALVVNY